MVNIKLVLEYDGTNYHGWQFQPVVPTIQGEVQRALKKILKKEVTVISAGRTDAGVHAKGQVANFKTSNLPLSPMQLLFALNSVLPQDIRVKDVKKVPEKFHAQKSACYKIYQYLIYNDAICRPWFRNFTWWISHPLDCELMREAAKKLIGRHDFSSFQNQGSPSESTVRTVEKIKIFKRKSLICIFIKADGFLYKMVRNIVGTLVEVGRGKLSPSKMRLILEAKDRREAGPTAPPQGLYLWRVGYPEIFDKT